MNIIADTHVHVYPHHNPARLFSAAAQSFARIAPQAQHRVLCLTETASCSFFESLATGLIPLEDQWSYEQAPEPGAVKLTHPTLGDLWLLAGRQLVAEERLEVLALTEDTLRVDGKPVVDIIHEVNALGAIPVLAWAPGKWFGARGKIVSELLDTFPPDRLLLGDSSLRPSGWGEPLLMRKAARRGAHILAGSDPLPVPGEETQAARYACGWDAEFDPAQPVTSIRAALRATSCTIQRVGERNTIPEMAQRMWNHREAKKRRV